MSTEVNIHIAGLSFLGLAAAIVFYYATKGSDMEVYVPANQHRDQVMTGMGIQGGFTELGEGGPLDMRPELHFWAPGFKGFVGDEPGYQNQVTTPHRYPALPGGNISSVIHQGWGGFCRNQPGDNDWRCNPPEAAVI